LGGLRGAADGLASLDSAGKVPTSELPVIPTGNLPAASTTQKGIIEIATNTEAGAYSDTGRAIVPSNLAALRGATNGLASLDGSALLPTAQLPTIPLANIPTLTNAKLPVLELAKIPTLPANKINLAPATWVVDADNFANSANFVYQQTVDSNAITLGAPQLAGYEGTSGFILVTRGLEVDTPFITINDTTWRGTVNTWVSPTTSLNGLTGDVLIGYYIASASSVIYTASMVSQL